MSAPKVRYGLLIGTFWPSMCASYLLVVLLQERCMSNTAIGAVMAINSVISILVQPVWGTLCDWIGSVKKVFLLCSTATMLLFTSLALIKNLPLLVAVIFLDALFRCSQISLSDHWLVTAVNRYGGLDYGRVRVIGSITYAATSGLYGLLQQNYSMQAVILASGLFALFNVLAALLAPDTCEKPVQHRHTGLSAQIIHVFRIRPFAAVAIFLIFAGFSSSCTTNFMPNVFARFGAGSQYVSFAQSLKALCEIPLFIAGGQLLKRFQSRRMIFLAASVTFCAYAGFVLASSPAAVVILHIFIGAGYSLMTTAKLHHVYQVVPAAWSATAFTVIGACEYGLGTILGSYIGGWMLDRWPVQIVLLCSACAYLAGFLFFCLVSGKGGTGMSGQPPAATGPSANDARLQKGSRRVN